MGSRRRRGLVKDNDRKLVKVHDGAGASQPQPPAGASCSSGHVCWSRAGAIAALRRSTSVRHPHEGRPPEVFHCKRCGWWHYGHTTSQANKERRARRLRQRTRGQ